MGLWCQDFNHIFRDILKLGVPPSSVTTFLMFWEFRCFSFNGIKGKGMFEDYCFIGGEILKYYYIKGYWFFCVKVGWGRIMIVVLKGLLLAFRRDTERFI